MKTATAVIEMKVETKIIGTKIVSVNQVLMIIRLDPVVRHSLQRSVPMVPFLRSTSPIVFSL